MKKELKSKENMVLKKASIIFFVLMMMLTYSWLFLPRVVRAGISDYDSNDFQKLQTFLNYQGNGTKLNVNYDPNDPTTWLGVTWNTDNPKKITRIEWENKNLVGSLDLK